MWNKYFVILTGFLLLNGIGNYQCVGDRVDSQFPLGTIGCLFSDICAPDESCHDDYLFGTCSGGESSDFAYTLTKGDLRKVEKELSTLAENQLTWLDGYTQCILQNVIVSLLSRVPFSKKLCYSLIDTPDQVPDDMRSSLANLWERTVEFDKATPQIGGFPFLPNSQKRDEIIKVHKYFDESQNLHKRNRQGPNYLSYDPNDDIAPYYPSNLGKFDSQNELALNDDDLTLDDLRLLEIFLSKERDVQKGGAPSKLSQLFSLEQGGPYQEELMEEYRPGDVEMREEEQPGYMWADEGDMYDLGMPETEETEIPDETMEEVPVVDEEAEDQLLDALPPKMANRLDQLIRGKVQAQDLSNDELNYLSVYVSKMLEHLGDTDEQEEHLDPIKALTSDAMQMDMAQEKDGIPFGVEEEDMNLNVKPSPLLAAIANADDVIMNGGDVMMEKKSADMEDAEVQGPIEGPQEDVAFIRMDKKLTRETSQQLIDAVGQVVYANPGSLKKWVVKGDTLEIFVDPILAGLNATNVADQARAHKLDLEKATGLKFEESGHMEKDKDSLNAFREFKAADDRYFVLTFVLCGCIAGILLAVVVIYLIRRSGQSREKLQQIGSVQEGNEAASKDYQDLCRQRMQSKSSEKPEPLHAASRVGSTSESQVRSPSSRSSTSSWSEEPVNSNMDISTGHIVLSYMEDHLKNKDRLDREWEAMCAYEADPCSTKIAEDPSNARKNRYADVLPYDHSRVVLTTNTNVSGSDYINASTITDHDPRNPAYIATQGPLPHTVADFWQMVWEQGSVVIVMLTKLKENGEDKCHRYWPEEGSDLYHIYEVHLVSEHNWCEDYIVRSFYLKNLQTSETRTVTQFHFLTWPDLGIPTSMKALLDFRRKVNKSYRGRSCPIVVHCSEGCARTGTYTLIDMVLNRMAKGAKEIDIAATLEHMRDQRMNIVKTKEQFQFALAAVAEEVHAILKALPQ